MLDQHTYFTTRFGCVRTTVSTVQMTTTESGSGVAETPVTAWSRVLQVLVVAEFVSTFLDFYGSVFITVFM